MACAFCPCHIFLLEKESEQNMNQKLNILAVNWQCIKNPSGGGAEVHFHEIFSRIAKAGHGVTLLCCEYEGGLAEEKIDEINIIRRGKRSTFNYGVRKIYRELIAKNRYDIVVDDINKIPFYMPRYVKLPLIAISHHFFGRSIFRETNSLAGMYVLVAEKLVDTFYKNTRFAVVSKSTLDEFIERGFNPDNFSIVPNAIHQEQYPMKVTEKYPNFTFTYFGRLKKYKSVDHFVAAFKNISDKYPHARMHFVGRGNFRPYLEKLCRKLGISDKTTFHGFVSDEEKESILKQSHCVVNTSMKEGWGITNIEANACGTPTISANVPGLRDSVRDGKSGLLYRYGDIDDLTEKMESLITDGKLLDRLSIGAVEWASEFSWDKSADMMTKVLKKTIEQHKSIF